VSRGRASSTLTYQIGTERGRLTASDATTTRRALLSSCLILRLLENISGMFKREGSLSLFRKPVECYFCGTPCPSARLSSPSSASGKAGCSFRCSECQSYNRYDHKGRIISDDPAMHDESMNTRSFARRGMFRLYILVQAENSAAGSFPTQEPPPVRVYIIQPVLSKLQDQPNPLNEPTSLIPTQRE
jgi:hypothetical protein